MAIETVANAPDTGCKIQLRRILSDQINPRFRRGEYIITDTSVEPADGDEVVITPVQRDAGGDILAELKSRDNGCVQFVRLSTGETIAMPFRAIRAITTVTGTYRRDRPPKIS